MCGIAGIIHSDLDREELEKVLSGMQQQLHHRGPDDRGLYLSRDGKTGLVNTRLAILDLSPAGHQPMASRNGRYRIVLNGEIYNFQTLRAELEGKGEAFRSHSDTEVVLKIYERYGPDSVRELEGMFALAIWDEQEQTCFLARDPLGIKPLYYYETNGAIWFASELRTLLGTGVVPRRLSLEAVSGYLLFGAVPEPLTLVEDVRTLPAGHYLRCEHGRVRLTKYWDIQFGDEPVPEREATELVRDALVESVGRHLVSDVPVGVFLSGGLDSTALVALASRYAGNELRTFCISFDDPKFDEGNVAAHTAQHFGAQHSDWRLDSAAARKLLATFLERSDQPSIDGFNSFCVSRLAHDAGLKVVLSGLGGDEVFGGYRSRRNSPNKIFLASNRTAWLFPSGGSDHLRSLLVYARDFYTVRGAGIARALRRQRRATCASNCVSCAFSADPRRRSKLPRIDAVHAQSALTRQRCDEYGMEFGATSAVRRSQIRRNNATNPSRGAARTREEDFAGCCAGDSRVGARAAKARIYISVQRLDYR